MDNIVIVGASLAGTKAAEKLRAEGYQGSLTMLSDELCTPYNRPPLSKGFLTGDSSLDELSLLNPRDWDELRIDFRAGSRATRLDIQNRELTLAGGSRLGFDGLVLATGARARMLPGLPPGPRIHLLRTFHDATRLGEALRPGVRLAVLGAGFLGTEVASSAEALGAEVTVLERADIPMNRLLSPTIGRRFAEIHTAGGISLLTGALVTDVCPDVDGVTIHIESRPDLRVDHVLCAIGTLPNDDWLVDSGAEVADGVVTDEKLFAGTNIVAAGDVARIRRGDGSLGPRTEHWTSAAAQGELAAQNLLVGPDSAKPFSALPYVWSDQFGSRIEVLGHPGPDDEVELLWAAAAGRRELYACYRDGDLQALVGLNAVRWILMVRKWAANSSSMSADMVERLTAQLTHSP